eukprot:748795-Hanusia_phi.AAC.7
MGDSSKLSSASAASVAGDGSSGAGLSSVSALVYPEGTSITPSTHLPVITVCLRGQDEEEGDQQLSWKHQAHETDLHQRQVEHLQQHHPAEAYHTPASPVPVLQAARARAGFRQMDESARYEGSPTAFCTEHRETPRSWTASRFMSSTIMVDKAMSTSPLLAADA